MLRVNNEDCPIDRYAPPMAARPPDKRTHAYLKYPTFTPAVSVASGFSPAARNRKPNGVRYRTYHVTGTRANAITIGALGIKFVRGICGVEPVVPKSAPLRRVGTPNIRMLIAVPLTTW